MLRASQSKLLPDDELADMRRMMTADQYDRELECSYDPAVPTWTAWDLGVGNATAVICAQLVGKEVHIIDYFEDVGQPLTYYVAWLNAKPYRYDTDLLPHDAGARELGTGKTREELLRANGRKVRTLKQQGIEDGIHATKMLLGRCWFDRGRTERMRECLANYHREWKDKMGVFRETPVHDWSSDCADAMRTLAMGLRETEKPRYPDYVSSGRRGASTGAAIFPGWGCDHHAAKLGMTPAAPCLVSGLNCCKRLGRAELRWPNQQAQLFLSSGGTKLSSARAS